MRMTVSSCNNNNNVSSDCQNFVTVTNLLRDSAISIEITSFENGSGKFFQICGIVVLGNMENVFLEFILLNYQETKHKQRLDEREFLMLKEGIFNFLTVFTSSNKSLRNPLSSSFSMCPLLS